MKNKKSVYILLVAVLAIWSLIVMRFFTLRNGNSNLVVQKQIIQIKTEKDTALVEYNLLLNYDDPFFSKKNEKVKKINTKSQSQKTDNIKEKNKPNHAQQKVPIITYNGMLRNASTGKKVGFLITERKEYMVEAGDIINDLRIVQLWNDSVRVAWNKQTYDIKRNSD